MVLKNMFQHVVIIEKSKIIRDGIFSLLTSHKVSKAITVLKDFEEWTVALGEKKPDVVILNHNLSKEDIKKIKSKYNLPGNTLFVAIIYDYYLPEEISELFDEVIFITDSEETFVNKFHRLSKNKDDHFDRDERERLTDREKDVFWYKDFPIRKWPNSWPSVRTL